jgi:DNA-binding NtrC family response regulator
MAVYRGPIAAESEMDLFPGLKNLKVLLVDDDEWIRHSLSLFFEGEGFHIMAIETAEEGMEIVKEQIFDIIISDYRLPGMNGLEFLRWVRRVSPKAKRILVTGYGNEDIITGAREIGIRDCIWKPFSSSAFEDSIKQMVQPQADSHEHGTRELIYG